VDKFIGDAIMAIWNAPLTQEEHAKLACKSAIAQIKKLEGLKGKWKEKGLPEIKIGCGINTGVVVVGNMGSQERFSYTAMGDGVNLSSRLEGLTKVYGVKIIISRDTKNKIGKEFNCRLLDRVRVKGKKIPVEIYELLVREEPSDFVKEYEHALSLYFARKFPESKREFEKCLSLKKDDKSCLLFVERCKEYMMHSPPKEWDGSFEMKSK
jgi:adenylate cyclase